MLDVCVLSNDPNFTSESIEFLRRYFRVIVLSLDFPSFSWARNYCSSMSSEKYIMRFDTDEKLVNPEKAIVSIKRDLLKYELIFAKIINNVGKYRWYGWKLIIHPSKLKYIGADHEVLYTDTGDDFFPHKFPRVYDDDIEIENNKTERQYMLSLARTYYFGGAYDKDWFKLRQIIGNVTVPKFYKIVSSPPEELKKWAESHTSCDNGRGFYYYFFESYPNECYLDPPLFEKVANEIYNKVHYYDSFLPYYYASHRNINLDDLAKLNRIYMHVFGRPVDQSGIEAYIHKVDKPYELIRDLILSRWVDHG